MNNENNGKSRMFKDAPAALCEFVGVDPARKWAQCERERDEWAALAGQYKSERDEAREKYDNLATEHMLVVNKLCEERDEAQNASEAFSALAWKLEGERNEAREALREIAAADWRTSGELRGMAKQVLEVAK